MHIRPFEIGLIIFFAISAIVGLILVSNYKSDNSEENFYGTSVSIWGTFESSSMRNLIFELSRDNKAHKVVSYTQIDPRTFDLDLINAIAEGKSPDLVILPNSKLVTLRSKLQSVSFEVINERNFRDTYVDGADIFISSDGVYGIPIAVDPLVMYWNRDIFSTSGVSQPPKTWSTLMSQTVRGITRTDNNRGISRSAVAFGEYSNIVYAKEILSMLFLQAGSTIIDESYGRYSVTLNESIYNNVLNPGNAVLNFYTQFALSNKAMYSWNRSQESDRKEFLKGDLALYFGLGSEYKTIERDNVNLNFDIAPVPQDVSATIRRTYADFYAFVIPRASDNPNGAYAVAQYLSSAGPVQKIIDAYGLAPALRSLHVGNKSDIVKNVIYPESLIARGWLDPSPKKSSLVFQNMVERVTSGGARVVNIVSDAVIELESLFR